MRSRLSYFNLVSLTLGFAFLYLPIVLLVVYSFNDSRLVAVWGGFSTRWYAGIWQNEALLDAAWVTLRSRSCAWAASGGACCSPAWSMRHW